MITSNITITYIYHQHHWKSPSESIYRHMLFLSHIVYILPFIRFFLSSNLSNILKRRRVRKGGGRRRKKGKKGKGKKRERDRRRPRQADRQPASQIDSQIDRQTNRQPARQTDRLTAALAICRPPRQTDRLLMDAVGKIRPNQSLLKAMVTYYLPVTPPSSFSLFLSCLSSPIPLILPIPLPFP